MTHRSLLGPLLALDVWDLPLVVQPWHRCALLLLPWSFAGCRSPASDTHCYDCCTVDKITALVTLTLSLALEITNSLQTLSYSDHTSLDTKRSKWTFSCHGSNRKENWTLITHFEIIKNITHFKNTSENNFHSIHRHENYKCCIWRTNTP